MSSYGMSSGARIHDDPAPRHHVRWFHAGPPSLLSIVPTVVGSVPTWQPLTRGESDACEEAWQELNPEARFSVAKPGDQDAEDDKDETRVGIPVSNDKLFEVDVRSMQLKPVFWKTTGKIPVMRAQWMHDETRPVEQPLGELLERAYQRVKPWKASYPVELQTALEIGEEALDKIKTPLMLPYGQPQLTSKPDVNVVFEDEAVARVITGAIRKPFSSIITSFASRSKQQPPTVAQLGGSVYYRGSDEAAVRGRQNRSQSPMIRSRSPSLPRPLTSASGVVRNAAGNDTKVKRPAGSRESSREAKPARITTAAGAARTPPNAEMAGVEDLTSPKDRTGFSTRPKQTKIDAMAEISAPALAAPISGGTAVNPSTTSGTQTVVQGRKQDGSPMGEVTDLILVVHGIGQGLTATYEAFDFVYVTNMLRQIARTQSQSPALASIMREKRVQFLPVQWRASLKLDLGDELMKQREGLDNHFTLEDITLRNSIPFVRELTNQVLLDIPLFMSHHRERMIESVCTIANRTYRLWCARNPEFEKHGKVHIVAHSLGSALVSHILSNQPTIQPPLSEIPQELKDSRSQFLFNTSNLFLIGSPLGMFVHLNQAQIIARKGRERTRNSPSDEALDRVGIFGCMAIDALYNIFNTADPVTYLLNPCVDAARAKVLPATAIPDVSEGYLSTFSSWMSKMMNNISIPVVPSTNPKKWFGGGASIAGSPNTSGTNPMLSSPKGGSSPNGIVEMELASDGIHDVRGTKAERRFLALNPHGTLDYYLPLASGIGSFGGDYVEMMTAHSSYWTHESFAAFVMAEIFATSADYLRTGALVHGVQVTGD
ncbi:hypothetical protein FRB93_011149 [Tulasnella sp. JGI-2019a]|nr:hypothetical protein FRB93_011149 [Tulasnella sp. JGI-2019a]